MKELIELVQLVTKQKTQSIQIVGADGSGDTLLDSFYSGLSNQQFTSDEEAAEQLLDSSEKDINYRRLKSTLKSRLVNTLFFIDVKRPSFTEYQRAFYTCNKDWAAVKILLGREARAAGIDLALKVFSHALKFEFTDLVIDVSRILRMHYSIYEPDEKKYEYYHNLVQEYREIQYAETLAEEYFQLITKEYALSKSTKKEIAAEAARYHNQLKIYTDRFKSHNLHFFSYLIEVNRYMGVNDYKGTVDVCNRAIEFFESKPYKTKVVLATFYYQKLASLTQLKEYEEGNQIAENVLTLIKKGGINWFKALELYYILSMHTGNYEKAATVVKKATSHRRFSFLQPYDQEMWTIYEAYVKYLDYAGRIGPGDEKSTKRFRAGKFLNEVPIYSKDKRGMNIPILVIQIMFMIAQNKRDAAIDRIEAIKTYCSRYLQKDDTFRSNVFIKMLLQIPSCGFDKEKILERAAKYEAMLKETPIDIAYQSYEIEILPYEEVWEMILESL